jgi:hypothetical protein
MRRDFSSSGCRLSSSLAAFAGGEVDDRGGFTKNPRASMYFFFLF